jgi:hypothetical protein
MRPEEMAQGLAQAGTTLDQNLRVVENGRVACCIGLTAMFYLRSRPGESLRERAVRALERYRAAISDQLVWGADPKTAHPRRVAGTRLLDVRSRLLQLDEDKDLEFVFHGAKRKDEADSRQVIGLIHPEDSSDLSWFAIGLPFSWMATHEPGAFSTLVFDLCEILAPLHGYAGLAVIPYVVVHICAPAMDSILGLIARFRGLDLGYPFSQAYFLRHGDVIKGINWLTILDQSFVERLGGERPLCNALGAGVGWLPFRSGVVIQAGDHPLFGDVNVQEPMPPYEQVAEALRPIRATKIGSFGYRFNDERTDQWLRRFDRKPS